MIFVFHDVILNAKFCSIFFKYFVYRKFIEVYEIFGLVHIQSVNPKENL